MAKIVIVGGHGKVSLLAEPLLVNNGHEVDAIIRKQEQSQEIADTGANPVVLDIENASIDDLTKAFEGADVVVWSAGAGGGDISRTYAVDRDAAARTVEAANKAGVDRFVMVSWFGAKADHGIDPENDFWHYAEAKYTADRYVQARAKNWTILGPSTLTENEGTGAVEIALPGENVQHGEVARADVAAMITAVVDKPETAGKYINFNNGATPIDHALEALT